MELNRKLFNDNFQKEPLHYRGSFFPKPVEFFKCNVIV